MSHPSFGIPVTLPSNSNNVAHPKNTKSLYTVKLGAPLNFASNTLNDTQRWCVAMTSMHYTNNFYNFRESCLLRVILEAPQIGATDQSERASSACTCVSMRTETNDNLDETDVSFIRRFLSPTGLFGSGNALFGKVLIPMKHYPSAAMVAEELVSQFNKIFSPRYRVQLRMDLRPKGGVLNFELTNGKPVVVCADRSYIGQVLGLPCTEEIIPLLEKELPPVDAESGVAKDASEPATSSTSTTPAVSSTTGTSKPTVKLFKLSLRGEKSPRLNRLKALYVYTDVAEQQSVGEGMAPLLAIVDVEKGPGERVGFRPSPYDFKLVCKAYIDEITVKIADEHGEPVLFADDDENVVVAMRFCKVDSGLMLY